MMKAIIIYVASLALAVWVSTFSATLAATADTPLGQVVYVVRCVPSQAGAAWLCVDKDRVTEIRRALP
jgi:hypothetical protein